MLSLVESAIISHMAPRNYYLFCLSHGVPKVITVQLDQLRARPHQGVPDRNRCCHWESGPNGGRIRWVQTEAPVGVSEVIVALCLPENGEDQAKTVIQNCCSQTTLATAVDDSALGWTEFVHASLAGLARVPVSAGTVPRIRNFCGDLLRAWFCDRSRPKLCPHTLLLVPRLRSAWMPNANVAAPFSVYGVRAHFRHCSLFREVVEWGRVRVVLRLKICGTNQSGEWVWGCGCGFHMHVCGCHTHCTPKICSEGMINTLS